MRTSALKLAHLCASLLLLLPSSSTASSLTLHQSAQDRPKLDKRLYSVLPLVPGISDSGPANDTARYLKPQSGGGLAGYSPIAESNTGIGGSRMVCQSFFSL